jgi:hypothetical protein
VHFDGSPTHHGTASDAPRDGWTQAAKVAAMAWFTNGKQPAFPPFARFSKRGASFASPDRDLVVAAASRVFAYKGHTFFPTSDAKPPKPPADKVKIVGLPLGATERHIRAALVAHGAEVRHIEQDKLLDGSLVLALLDSAVAFLEPGSAPTRLLPVTLDDGFVYKCRVFDNRLPSSSPNTKRPRPVDRDELPQPPPHTSALRAAEMELQVINERNYRMREDGVILTAEQQQQQDQADEAIYARAKAAGMLLVEPVDMGPTITIEPRPAQLTPMTTDGWTTPPTARRNSDSGARPTKRAATDATTTEMDAGAVPVANRFDALSTTGDEDNYGGGDPHEMVASDL